MDLQPISRGENPAQPEGFSHSSSRTLTKDSPSTLSSGKKESPSCFESIIQAIFDCFRKLFCCCLGESESDQDENKRAIVKEEFVGKVDEVFDAFDRNEGCRQKAFISIKVGENQCKNVFTYLPGMGDTAQARRAFKEGADAFITEVSKGKGTINETSAIKIVFVREREDKQFDLFYETVDYTRSKDINGYSRVQASSRGWDLADGAVRTRFIQKIQDQLGCEVSQNLVLNPSGQLRLTE